MNKHILLALLIAAFAIKGYAQVANDQCANAITLPVTTGTCQSDVYTITGATTEASDPIPNCWVPATVSHTVWFKFQPGSTSVEISTNFGNTLTNSQIALYSGTCGALTLIACQEDINTSSGFLHTSIRINGLNTANTYYIMVDGNGTLIGDFGICVQNIIPPGPIQPEQDCETAVFLCDKDNVSVASGPFNTGTVIDQDATSSCFGTEERASHWYTFRAANNGTFDLTITPITPIDYDFIVYDVTNGCANKQVLACNYAPCANGGGDGRTGIGCVEGGALNCLPAVDGDPCYNTTAGNGNPLNLIAGRTYAILVDRFEQANNSGFTLSLGGTVPFDAPSANFVASSVCAGRSLQFSNTSSTGVNGDYSWNFGDNATSQSRNPTHTYTNPGTYQVTLVTTARPEACTNAIIKDVIITAGPDVTVTPASVTQCTPSPVNLAGTATIQGSPNVNRSFANTNAVTIPDGGITDGNTWNGNQQSYGTSSIAVSGLNNTSWTFLSVNMNITHSFNSDIACYLKDPCGNYVKLFDNLNGANFRNTTFSPTAGAAIATGNSPYTGTFLPQTPRGGNLGIFTPGNCANPNGNWELRIGDDFGGDAGRIDNWSINFSTTNGIASYNWSPNADLTPNVNAQNVTVNPASTRTYTLSATDAIGCVGNKPVTITIGGSTGMPTVSNVSYCQGATAAPLTAGGTGLLWYTTASGGVGSSTAPTPSTATIGTTDYYVSQSSGGCESARARLTVTIVAGPAAPSIANNGPICSGSTLNLSTTATAVGMTYIWTGPASFAAGTQNPSIANATTAQAGNYDLKVVLNGCTSSVASTAVIINTTQSASFAISPLTNCKSSGINPTTTISGVAGGTFSYVPVSAAPNTLVINAATGAIDIAASDLGSYTVTYTTPGPCVGSSTRNVSITDNPDASFSYSGPYCKAGGTNPLPVFPAGAGAGTFSSSAGLVFVDPNTGEINLAASTPGTYTVTNTISTVGACTGDVKQNTIDITGNPSAPGVAPLAYCQGAVAPALTAAGTNLLWYTAAVGGASSATAPVPSTATVGTANCYVSQTVAGCESPRATLQVTTKANPAAPAASSNSPVCRGAGLNFTSSTAAVSPTYSWTGPNGFNSAQQNPTIASTQAADQGAYQVMVTEAGCTSSLTTVNVVINPPDDASFAYASSSYCLSGNDPTPSIVTPGGLFSATPAGLSIDISTGDIDLSASAPDTYQITYQVAATCANDSTISLSIVDAPNPAFNYSESYCINSASNPLPELTSDATIGKMTATPSGLSIDPSTGEIILASSTPGTYTITNTIPAANGCVQVTATDQVIIYPKPVASFTRNPVRACGDDTITVTLNGAISPIAEYRWDFGGANVVSGSGGGPYQVNWSTTGNKQVALVVVEHGCLSDSTKQSVSVNVEAPSPDFMMPDNACSGDSVTITYTGPGTSAGNTYTWAFDGGTKVTPAVGRGPYVIRWTTEGVKSVSLQITTNAGGCRSALNLRPIAITERPVADFVMPQEVCVGQDVVISYNGGSTAGKTFTWNFGGSATGNVSSSPGPFSSIHWNSIGTKTVRLNVSRPNCPASLSKTTQVFPYPKVDFTTSVDPLPAILSVGGNTTVEFYPNVDVADKYTWHFTATDSLVDINPVNQQFMYTTAGDYDVSLSAANHGCESASPRRRITLTDIGDIYIPTAFSPNEDGNNDYFKPVPIGVPSFTMEIFSRWGDKVYSGNENDRGWDGLVKTDKAPDGVYVYIVTGKTYGGQQKSIKGLVTLVR